MRRFPPSVQAFALAVVGTALLMALSAVNSWASGQMTGRDLGMVLQVAAVMVTGVAIVAAVRFLSRRRRS
jgi:hypothetical protein